MTQQDEGDICHFGNNIPLWVGLFFMSKREDELNKHDFFAFLRKSSADVNGTAKKVRTSDMGFPGTWMTETESVVYRVVPKCACSSIGQIMYYSDHGEFFEGDIHDAQGGMHKWAMDDSQP